MWRLGTHSRAPGLLELWENVMRGNDNLRYTWKKLLLMFKFDVSFSSLKWLCTFPKLGVARVHKRLHLILNALPDPFVYLLDLIQFFFSLPFIIIIDVDLSMTPYSMFHCSECVLEASPWFHVQSPPLLIFTSQSVVLKELCWP